MWVGTPAKSNENPSRAIRAAGAAKEAVFHPYRAYYGLWHWLRQSMSREKPQNNSQPRIWAEYGLLFLAVLAVVAAAYAPALSGGMLWDDDAHVPRPEMATLAGLWRIWFQLGATHQYYPLLFTAFWVEHQFWGESVVGYHVVNIVFHSVSACLVAAIMRKLALPGARLGAFMFALHPVCVESVAWISEQKNTLSTLFCLSAALVYLQFDTERKWRLYFVALALFILALLSKTVTATLPGALLVIFWWERGRLTVRRDVLPLAPWFALGGAAGMFTSWVERTYVGAEGSEFVMSTMNRLLLMGRIPLFYLGKLLWPGNLIFIYPRWNIDSAVWWQYLFPFALLILLAAAALLAPKNRAPLAILLIFLETLLPVSGLFHVYPFIYSYVADHFQYLASLAVLIPAASWLATASKRLFPTRSPAALAAQALVPCGLWVLTWHQAHVYQDAEVLYRAVLARNPECWMAYNNLGFRLLSKGRFDEAIAQLEQALRIDPGDAEAHNNLAIAFWREGRLEEAISQFEKALQIEPDFTQPAQALAFLLVTCPDARLRNGIEAEQLARHAVQVTGGRDAIVLGTLAAAYAEQGRFAEAMETVKGAMQVAESQGNSALLNTLQQHLDLYQRGQSLGGGASASAPRD